MPPFALIAAGTSFATDGTEAAEAMAGAAAAIPAQSRVASTPP